ncbi:MAG: U32 family peptidase [Desulfopila sp.]|jgi:putative protease|nr:U32 family peptidase [Desulfopila sp.]
MERDSVELLAPARDLECGIAAIEHGADAVYIGAPRFSARAAAGNSFDDIGRLMECAHQFHARVYVALNTLLRDEELSEAVDIAQKVYAMGADALIIQDLGLLECDLPPIPLHASTQVDNRSVAKVQFLEKVGFQQVVLARELTLAEITGIAKQTSVKLECFVHGALCVSYSGRCSISEVMTGRSANRGECTQFCRHRFSLHDGDGRTVAADRHLLSLKDLDLADSIPALIGAGVRSFKIEGRLKDSNYVKNITALYRQRLDQILESESALYPSSSGKCCYTFEPDPEKTFHRGRTHYFLHDRKNRPAFPATPKSVGKLTGTVGVVRERSVEIITEMDLHNGDGLCYFDEQEHLVGFRVNRVEGRWVYPHGKISPLPGAKIYRNNDVQFNRSLQNSEKCRKIEVAVTVTEKATGLSFAIVDEDEIASCTSIESAATPAMQPDKTIGSLRQQAQKSGDTIFTATAVRIEVNPERYYPPSLVKELRRKAFAAHLWKRLRYHKKPHILLQPNTVPWPEEEFSGIDNIVNSRAEVFYSRHGVVLPEKRRSTPEQLMSCRYCVKQQLGICPREGKEEHSSYKEPFILADKNGTYRLVFHCHRCEMTVEKFEKGEKS